MENSLENGVKLKKLKLKNKNKGLGTSPYFFDLKYEPLNNIKRDFSITHLCYYNIEKLCGFYSFGGKNEETSETNYFGNDGNNNGYYPYSCVRKYY